jgi:hypothetical protein
MTRTRTLLAGPRVTTITAVPYGPDSGRFGFRTQRRRALGRSVPVRDDFACARDPCSVAARTTSS